MNLIKDTNEILDMQKSELKKTGSEAFEIDLAKVDKGETSATALIMTARKAVEILNGYIDAAKDAVKEELAKEGGNNPMIKVRGSEISLTNTGDRLDFDKDDTYALLKARLKDRENLLRTAYRSKETLYDSEGAEIIRVPVKTFGGEIVKIKL